MSAPSLRRNFVWVFLGTLALAATQLILPMLIAKIAPTGEEGARRVGAWTLANAITGPVFVFFLFKLRVLQTTDAREEHAWPTYAVVRVLGMVVAVAITAGIVIVRYRDAVGGVIVVVALAKAFDGGSDILYGVLQRHERLDRVARSQIARGLAGLVLGAGALLVTGSMIAVLLALAAVYAIGLAWDVAVTRRLFALTRPRWDRDAVGRMLRQCGPLGFVTALGSLQTNIPRYFLEHHASRVDLGVFGMMQTLLSLGALVVNAVAYAALARLARHAAAAEWRLFAGTLRRLVVIGTGLAIGAVAVTYAVGEPVLRLFFNDAFAGRREVMVWMAVTSGLVWIYLFFGAALDAMRRYRLQPWIHGASTAAIVLASIWMVPRWGMYGAMLVGYALECVLFVVAVAVPLRAELRRHAVAAAP